MYRYAHAWINVEQSNLQSRKSIPVLLLTSARNVFMILSLVVWVWCAAEIHYVDWGNSIVNCAAWPDIPFYYSVDYNLTALCCSFGWCWTLNLLIGYPLYKKFMPFELKSRGDHSLSNFVSNCQSVCRCHDYRNCHDMCKIVTWPEHYIFK